MTKQLTTPFRIPSTLGLLLIALLSFSTPLSASCGMSPEQYTLDTIAPGTVAVSYQDSPQPKDTTYFRRLADTLVTIMRLYKSAALAQVRSSHCVEISPSSTPEPMMRCSISVRIDSTLKGPLKQGQELTFILGLTDFPDFYEKRIGKGFLIYHDSLTRSNINIRPPCYSFEHGFFVDNRTLTNREVALGHSITLDSLAKLSANTSLSPDKRRNRKAKGPRRTQAGKADVLPEVSSLGRRLPATETDSRPSLIRFPGL